MGTKAVSLMEFMRSVQKEIVHRILWYCFDHRSDVLGIALGVSKELRCHIFSMPTIELTGSGTPDPVYLARLLQKFSRVRLSSKTEQGVPFQAAVVAALDSLTASGASSWRGLEGIEIRADCLTNRDVWQLHVCLPLFPLKQLYIISTLADVCNQVVPLTHSLPLLSSMEDFRLMALSSFEVWTVFEFLGSTTSLKKLRLDVQLPMLLQDGNAVGMVSPEMLALPVRMNSSLLSTLHLSKLSFQTMLQWRHCCDAIEKCTNLKHLELRAVFYQMMDDERSEGQGPVGPVISIVKACSNLESLCIDGPNWNDAAGSKELSEALGGLSSLHTLELRMSTVDGDPTGDIDLEFFAHSLSKCTRLVNLSLAWIDFDCSDFSRVPSFPPVVHFSSEQCFRVSDEQSILSKLSDQHLNSLDLRDLLLYPEAMDEDDSQYPRPISPNLLDLSGPFSLSLQKSKLPISDLQHLCTNREPQNRAQGFIDLLNCLKKFRNLAVVTLHPFEEEDFPELVGLALQDLRDARPSIALTLAGT